METKATLKVVRARVNRVLIYSRIENATLSLLPWTLQTLFQNGQYFVATFVCLLVGCLTSQQQASVSQGRICRDNFTCCHTEIEAADQTF